MHFDATAVVLQWQHSVAIIITVIQYAFCRSLVSTFIIMPSSVAIRSSEKKSALLTFKGCYWLEFFSTIVSQYALPNEIVCFARFT